MNKSETMKIIAVLKAAWPNHPFTEQSVEVYHRALDDLTYEQVNNAVAKAIQTEIFCPVPAVIRNILGANDEGTDEAEVEWGKVRSEISRVGIYKAPIFDNPITDAAVRAIGWPELCLMLQTEVIANRKHFYDTYKAFARKSRTENAKAIGQPETPALT